MMKGGSGTATLMAGAVVVLLFVATPAFAAQGSFSIQSELPVTVEGPRTTSADGDFLLEGDQGTASFLLEGQNGNLQRVIHRAYGYIRPEEPQAGVLWDQTVETIDVPLGGTYLTLTDRLPGFTLLAYDADVRLQDGAAQGPLHIGALSSDKTVESHVEPPLSLTLGRSQAKPFEHVVDRGLYQARAMDARTTVEGAFRLFIDDAELRLQAPDQDRPTLLQAHFREEQRPGSLYDPVQGRWFGMGSHTEYVHEYLLLDLVDARMQIQHMDTPAFVYTDAPSLAIDGTATFPAATGTVTVHEESGDTVHGLDGDELRLGGRFTMDLSGATLTRTDASGDGDLTQVTYAAQVHEYDWTTIAATGLGALALAGLAWATGAGKWILGSTGGLVAGYARVHGEEVLEHPGRMEVYERVKAEPGLHFMDLGKRVSFGASTLNYHLRVLERNGYITRVKDGRYVRFFDRQSGDYSRDRKKAASTLRNRTTAAIAAHIVQNPGVVQRDLATHFGIAASTVSWHVGRLQQNGLIEKQRDQHFTRYYMGEAWSTLPQDELARVGLVA